MKVQEFSKQAVSAEQLCKSNFATAMSQQQIDGYKSAFTADGYCVENKNFSSRECRREKIPLRANFSSSGK